jgi:hypothetical protein
MRRDGGHRAVGAQALGIDSAMPSKLVREAGGVKQLHQLPPELAHLGGFLSGECFLFCDGFRPM